MNNSQESVQGVYRVEFMCLLQEEISGCQCAGCAIALWLCKFFFFEWAEALAKVQMTSLYIIFRDPYADQEDMELYLNSRP